MVESVMARSRVQIQPKPKNFIMLQRATERDGVKIHSQRTNDRTSVYMGIDIADDKEFYKAWPWVQVML